MNPYRDKVAEILANAEMYHRAFYLAGPFRGPSLYFHQRALQTRLSANFVNHIAEAQQFTPQYMDAQSSIVLSKIFQSIKVMDSGTSLVGNSRVMHHMMPNIVPPIDRAYTLRYLRGNTTITNDLDREWHTMKAIISDFFVPIACDAVFESKAGRWIASQGEFPWDTSALKVVDNLVIGSRK